MNFGQTEQEFGACLSSLVAALKAAGFVAESGTDAARQVWTAVALVSDAEVADYLFGKRTTVTGEKLVQVKMAACNEAKAALAKRAPDLLALLARRQREQLAALPVTPGQTPTALASIKPVGLLAALGVSAAAFGVGLYCTLKG